MVALEAFSRYSSNWPVVSGVVTCSDSVSSKDRRSVSLSVEVAEPPIGWTLPFIFSGGRLGKAGARYARSCVTLSALGAKARRVSASGRASRAQRPC